MNITNNFTTDEMKCKCGCGQMNIDLSSVQALQMFREHIGIQIIVKSACRCVSHNHQCRGKIYSWHISKSDVEARAFDIRTEKHTPWELMRELESWDSCKFFTGRGVYPPNGFIHIDTGHGKLTRWISRNGVYRTVSNFPECL